MIRDLVLRLRSALDNLYATLGVYSDRAPDVDGIYIALVHGDDENTFSINSPKDIDVRIRLVIRYELSQLSDDFDESAAQDDTFKIVRNLCSGVIFAGSRWNHISTSFGYDDSGTKKYYLSENKIEGKL